MMWTRRNRYVLALVACACAMLLPPGCGDPEEPPNPPPPQEPPPQEPPQDLHRAPDEALDEMRGTTGEDFAALRDALFRNDMADVRSAIEDRCPTPGAPWADRHLCYILKGWFGHRSIYRSLVDAPRGPDGTGPLRYAWIYDMDDVPPSAMPLMHDLLVRRSEGTHGQRDAEAVLIANAGKAVIRLDLLLEGLRQPDGTLDDATRRRIANVAGALGSEATIPDPRRGFFLNFGFLTLRHELGRSTPDLQVARPLLDFVVRIGARSPAASIDTFTTVLRAESGLVATVGASFFAQRIARVGGSLASQHVGDYLSNTVNDGDHRWGVRAASRMDYSSQLASYLVDVMKGADAPFSEDDGLRRQGMRSYAAMLSRYDYSQPADKAILNAMALHLSQVPDTAYPEGSKLRAEFDALTAMMTAAIDDN